MGGAGIQPGGVIGKTNDNGTAVADREVDHGHMFHTFMQAVGVDSTGHFEISGRELPIADPAAPIPNRYTTIRSKDWTGRLTAATNEGKEPKPFSDIVGIRLVGEWLCW